MEAPEAHRFRDLRPLVIGLAAPAAGALLCVLCLWVNGRVHVPARARWRSMMTIRRVFLAVLFALTAGLSLAEAGTAAPDGSGCTCPLCLGVDSPGTTIAP